MGYTHYWEIHEQITNDEWKTFTDMCRLIFKNLPKYSHSSGGYYSDVPLYICGEITRYPSITKQYVCFNGSDIHPKHRVKTTITYRNGETKGRYVKSEHELNDKYAHETFYFRRSTANHRSHIASCKTAQKPYDLVVQACLICAKAVFKEKITVSSDGKLEDWKHALQFVGTIIPSPEVKRFVLQVGMNEKTLFD